MLSLLVSDCSEVAAEDKGPSCGGWTSFLWLSNPLSSPVTSTFVGILGWGGGVTFTPSFSPRDPPSRVYCFPHLVRLVFVLVLFSAGLLAFPCCFEPLAIPEGSLTRLGVLVSPFFYPFQTSEHRLNTRAVKANQVLLQGIKKVYYKSRGTGVVMEFFGKSIYLFKKEVSFN